MEAISEKALRNVMQHICKVFELTADYQQGNGALCWRVTFMDGAKLSNELVGTTRRELYNAMHSFRYGMEFGARISRAGEES